jgi:hypothetical protein
LTTEVIAWFPRLFLIALSSDQELSVRHSRLPSHLADRVDNPQVGPLAFPRMDLASMRGVEDFVTSEVRAFVLGHGFAFHSCSFWRLSLFTHMHEFGFSSVNRHVCITL